jgi:hypothetical protein
VGGDVPSHLLDHPDLDEWIHRSFTHARQLPAKQPNKK